jgi:hypothetical protein
MEMASFSKCTGSSRAFAQGLPRWLSLAARSDLHFSQRRRRALAVIFGQDVLGIATTAWGEKPQGLWLLFISQRGPPTAGWISLRSADSAAACDSSTSTSRRASSRGLGYFYSTTWEATRLRSISGHMLQDDPSIREELLDSRLGGSVPRVLRFFLRIFRDILAKTSDGPSTRVCNST